MFSVRTIAAHFAGHWRGQSSPCCKKRYQVNIPQAACKIHFKLRLLTDVNFVARRRDSRYTCTRDVQSRLSPIAIDHGNEWKALCIYPFPFFLVGRSSAEIGGRSMFSGENKSGRSWPIGLAIKGELRHDVERNPVRGWFNSRWWWNRRWRELDLYDVSLRMSERGRIIFAMNCSSVTLLFDREIIPGRIARGRLFIRSYGALGKKSVLDNRALFVRKRERKRKRKEEETVRRRSNKSPRKGRIMIFFYWKRVYSGSTMSVLVLALRTYKNILNNKSP